MEDATNMLSRQQVLDRLYSLKNFSFVAYLDKRPDGSHLVRLRINEFEKSGLSPQTYIQDFIVTEENGYLSAASVSMKIKIDRLS